MYTGCYVIESLLQSDLRCFYNQTCITKLQSYSLAKTTMNVTALDKSLPSNFTENSTIEELVNQLMVEEWNPLIMYENYYNECQPSQCTYTHETKNSVIYIVTTLVGLIGGLITALKLIVPRLVKFIRRKKELARSEIETIEQQQRFHIVKKLRDYVRTLNVFPSIPPTNDEHQLRNERISTKLFIVLLISSLAILLFYTSLIDVTQTVNIREPTFAKYSQLYSAYPQTLTCPCTKISINYNTFLQLQYTFHQVCNSIFVNKDWIDYLFFVFLGNGSVRTDDFRSIATNTFQGLSSFCALVNQTISNGLTQFNSTQYISASVIPLKAFESEISSLTKQFISSTANDFLLSLSTIRDTTQSNSLRSALQTNFNFYIPTHGTIGAGAYPNPILYENCNCATSATCAYQSRIYRSVSLADPTVLFYVPGMYIGCYVIESLLQSDLRCFYNQTCITKLQSYSLVNTTMNVTALDKSLPSNFTENSTIEELVNQLMVEKWDPLIMYENYYNECQPSQCTYTHETKNSVIYIVTTLFGLIG
ncbi:unnamed protein product, partial [Adineta steineri]